MSLPKDERDRILSMIEADQISAIQAAQLLDALESTEPLHTQPAPRAHERILRIRATSPGSRQQKVHFSASIPVQLLRLSLRLGSHILPQLSSGVLEDILRFTENGVTGRLLDLQDLEQGERLEIFVE
jgi:hypothetical protein